MRSRTSEPGTSDPGAAADRRHVERGGDPIRHRHQVEGYRLIAPIGVGGSATVYRAVQESTGADVAVKVLAENHSLVPSLRQRFLDEVQMMADVDNRSLAAVYEVGQTSAGQPFLVLELAARGDLRTRVELHRAEGLSPSPVDVAVLADHLTEALGALHDVGIVHRDVSPGNVLIAADPTAPQQMDDGRSVFDSDERLLVADLGLAKDLEARSGLTARCGTEGFAAPEQQGPVGVVDRRADVFGATALIAWFVADTALAEKLAPFIERGSAADLGRRHPTMDVWRHDLSQRLRAPTAAERFGSPWVLGAFVVGLAAVGVAGLSLGDDDDGNRALPTIPVPSSSTPVENEASDPLTVTSPDLTTAGSATTSTSEPSSETSSSVTNSSSTSPTTSPPGSSTTATSNPATTATTGDTPSTSDPFAGSPRASVTTPVDGQTVTGDLVITGIATYEPGIDEILLVFRPADRADRYWNVALGSFTPEFIRNPIPVEPAGGSRVSWSYTVPAEELEPGTYLVRAWARGSDGAGDPVSSTARVTIGE